MGFLIGCGSGLVARPRPPLGVLSARVIKTARTSEWRGRHESLCTGRREGYGRAVGRRVEVGEITFGLESRLMDLRGNVSADPLHPHVGRRSCGEL